MSESFDRTGIGGNRPPADPLARADELVATANRWIAERPAIADAEMAGIAQDFVAQLRKNRDELEAASKAERAPHERAVAAIRAKYRTPVELIAIAMTRMGEKLAPWLKREQDRLSAEAAERRRAAIAAASEADAARKAAERSGTVESELAMRDAAKAADALAEAAARPVARARVRGDLSPRAMTMKVTHYAIVTDPDAALKCYADRPEVREVALIEATKLASALARETKGNPAHCPVGFRFEKRQTPV